MTKEQFVSHWQHLLAGMVLDGATTQRTGADLALFVRWIMKKVDAHLATMYEQLCPQAPLAAPAKAPAVNGATSTAVRK